MKFNVNLTAVQLARLKSTLAPTETTYGFLAGAALREILRRERGGKVTLTERRAGRPRKPLPGFDQNGKPIIVSDC